ncbi:MAG: hypothetical protein OXO52_20760 [Rhodospirillales bacterium]|nr:hypothetical protein [Rhodospirillales bacterium]MDE0381473.1 hypothetical protein [Rhodospirillales bacterium]
MSEYEEERLWNKMRQCRDRLQRIADEEARAARLRSGAADGRYEEERDRLIDKMDELLDQLEGLGKNA